MPTSCNWSHFIINKNGISEIYAKIFQNLRKLRAETVTHMFTGFCVLRCSLFNRKFEGFERSHTGLWIRSAWNCVVSQILISWRNSKWKYSLQSFHVISQLNALVPWNIRRMGSYLRKGRALYIRKLSAHTRTLFPVLSSSCTSPNLLDTTVY